MPDSRTHRGPHPADRVLFAPARRACLVQAVSDFSWLLTRGYARRAATKLVGDRHQLRERQRIAVRRCSCSDAEWEARRSRCQDLGEFTGARLEIDGFNLICTIEAALCGGALLLGRDGVLRDMASVHGSYRLVAETRRAIEAIGAELESHGGPPVRWWLDAPVSNSGRLAGELRGVARARGWPWTVELVPDPDRELIAGAALAVSADRGVLDRCGPWCNLARSVVAARVPGAWVLDLRPTIGATGADGPPASPGRET